MKNPINVRDKLHLVALAAVLCLLVGSLVPPIMSGRQRPLADDVDMELTTEPTQGYLFRGSMLLQGKVPEQHQDDPECQSNDNPLWCYIEAGWVKQTSAATTSPTAEDSVVSSDTIQKFTFSDSPVCEVTQHVDLNRESTFPAVNDDMWMNIATPGLQRSLSSDDLERDGIDFFFPPTTEQRSYEYYDPFLGESRPIDFKEKKMIDGQPIYVYYQRLRGEPLQKLAEASASLSTYGLADAEIPAHADELPGISLEGDAFHFYTDDELKARKLKRNDTVFMDPYYSLERTVYVEPNTGIIVNKEETGGVYYARNREEAQQLADEPASPHRSLYTGTFNWDGKTQAAAMDAARPTILTLRVSNIIGWVGKVAGVALLLWAAVLYSRRRA